MISVVGKSIRFFSCNSIFCFSNIKLKHLNLNINNIVLVLYAYIYVFIYMSTDIYIYIHICLYIYKPFFSPNLPLTQLLKTKHSFLHHQQHLVFLCLLRKGSVIMVFIEVEKNVPIFWKAVLNLIHFH